MSQTFIDNHCHILPAGLDLAKLNLTETQSHGAVLDLLSQRAAHEPEGWLLAVHYDQNRYDGAHLTRSDLDGISKTRPILLRHSSGHAGVANTAALDMAGVDSSVKDVQGGTYLRDASGELNGVLLEDAFERVSSAIPKPTKDQMVLAILKAGEAMAEFGIVSSCDMHTGFLDLVGELEAYREAAERGCKIVMRLYLQWSKVFGPRALAPDRFRELIDSFDGTKCRVQGIKLFADGAIGSGTAAIYGAYVDAPHGESTSGTLMYKPDVLRERILKAAGEGWQVSVHSIGDYASDLVMDAFENTERPSYHRIEHAMILSPAQIERLSKVGCHVCVQPEFLECFGPTYRRKLRPEVSPNLNPVRSLLDAGLRVSFSSDRPITKGDPQLGIRLATDRPQGFNPAENCSRQEALHAYTVAAAAATGDEAWWLGQKS